MCPRLYLFVSGSSVTEDFGGAAVRHYRDGDLLQRNARMANADQLFGFAAECGIKCALATVLGLAGRGGLQSRYKEHIETLWDLAAIQSTQKRYPCLYAVLTGLQNPFADWSTDQRYGPDDVTSESAVGNHRTAAGRILGAVGLTGELRGS